MATAAKVREFPYRMRILILSASLHSESYSRLLARDAERVLQSDGVEVEFLDLRDLPLPLCDGEQTYSHANVAKAKTSVSAADGIIIATPIYNYDVNAALKNFVELSGKAWENKIVAFICTAGGVSSYMAIMSLVNSLMLDFRCVIVPRFVYATGAAFAVENVIEAAIVARVAECARETVRMAGALRGKLK